MLTRATATVVASVLCPLLVFPAVARAQPEGEVAEPPPEMPEDPEEPQSETERLYYEGAAKYSAADYEGAIDSFTRALSHATQDAASPEIRAALLANLANAHNKQYALDDDPMHLRKAKEIWKRIVDEGEDGLYTAETIAEAQSAIEQLDAKLEAHAEAHPEPEPDEKDPETVAPPPEPAQPVDTGADLSKGGAALLGTGLPLLAGGAVLLIYGTRFAPNAQAQVDEIEDPPDREEAFVDDETRRGRLLMGVGAGVAAAGLGLTVAGAVLMATKKKKDKDVALLPSPGGVVLVGRF